MRDDQPRSNAVTDNTAAPAPAGLWRRLWRFIEACEMSSAEHRDKRIDALERRIDALRQALPERAPAPDHDGAGKFARGAEQR
jgi:hypothetical protein